MWKILGLDYLGVYKTPRPQIDVSVGYIVANVHLRW